MAVNFCWPAILPHPYNTLCHLPVPPMLSVITKSLILPFERPTAFHAPQPGIFPNKRSGILFQDEQDWSFQFIWASWNLAHLGSPISEQSGGRLLLKNHNSETRPQIWHRVREVYSGSPKTESMNRGKWTNQIPSPVLVGHVPCSGGMLYSTLPALPPASPNWEDTFGLVSILIFSSSI